VGFPVILLLVLLASPVAAALIADILLRRGALWMWLGCLGLLILDIALNIVGWHVWPDYSGSPKAEVWSGLLMVGPSLIATFAVWQIGQRTQWTQGRRFGFAIGAGEAVLLLCFIPAGFLAVALGADSF